MSSDDRTITKPCPDPDKLEFNQACLTVENGMNSPITLWRTTKECYKCNMVFWWPTINPNDAADLTVYMDGIYQFGFQIANETTCKITQSFKSHGLYKWKANKDCGQVEVIKADDSVFISFLVYFIFLILLLVMLTQTERVITIAKRLAVPMGAKLGLKRRKKSEASVAMSTGTTVSVQTSGGSSVFPVPQLLSIQTFRGLVMLLIVMFDGSAAQRYWFFYKSVWNGVMPKDFLYPCFLWGMGAAFFMKYRSALLLHKPRWKLFLEVVGRFALYFLLGFCLNTFENNDLNQARIPGELQRYGFTHLVIFTVEVFCMKKEKQKGSTAKVWAGNLMQSLHVLGCVKLNLLLTYLLPVPGCPTGYTGPGGTHLQSQYVNCTGGASRYLDSLLFTDNHLELDSWSPVTVVYNTEVPFDTEGILGSLNSLLTVYSGVLTARVLVAFNKPKTQILVLSNAAAIQIVLGLCLCGFMKEEGLIPLNRSLYSLSFALLTAGVATLLFTALYFLIDVKSWLSGTPFLEAGFNSILLYIGHTVLQYSLPFSWTPKDKTTYNEYIIMDFITLSFWVFVALFTFKHHRLLLV